MTALSAARLAEAVAVRPSSRQLAWQRLELTGFVHFGMNTMTDREWGLGHEDPGLFAPDDLDVDDWVAALASAGMRGAILTCKHHDGFALWPTATSTHSVASSPWRDGGGDVVREFADACRAHGLRFGVYLSPWDRTDPTYGSGRAYDDVFVAQLTELLTGYGDVFCVWLDGANGEGPDGRVQEYDWDRYFAVVRELQPDAVLSVCGPDVRWCGNEAGATRADEWSVVPASLLDAERTAARSQQVDDGTFRSQVQRDDADLGSRAVLAATDDRFVWYPSEVNTSIRPGWFHHPSEDDAVRTVDELFDIYRGSVGGNAMMLLNVPPTRAGRIHTVDRERLRALGARIADLRARRIAEADVVVSSGAAPGPVGDDAEPWRPSESDAAPTVSFLLEPPTEVAEIAVRERIAEGQRVEGVRVLVTGVDGASTVVAEAGVVGHQRLLSFAPVAARRVDVVITASRATPVIDGISILAPQSAVVERDGQPHGRPGC